MRRFVDTGRIDSQGVVTRDTFRVDVTAGEDGRDTVIIKEDRSLTARVGSRLLGWTGNASRFTEEQDGYTSLGSTIDIHTSGTRGLTHLQIRAADVAIEGSQGTTINVEAFPVAVTGIKYNRFDLNVLLGRSFVATTIGEVAPEPTLALTGDARTGITFALPPR